MVLKKIISFEDQSEKNKYMDKYQEVEKTPFNLIYPKEVIDASSMSKCSFDNHIFAYF